MQNSDHQITNIKLYVSTKFYAESEAQKLELDKQSEKATKR